MICFLVCHMWSSQTLRCNLCGSLHGHKASKRIIPFPGMSRVPVQVMSLDTDLHIDRQDRATSTWVRPVLQECRGKYITFSSAEEFLQIFRSVWNQWHHIDVYQARQIVKERRLLHGTTCWAVKESDFTLSRAKIILESAPLSRYTREASHDCSHALTRQVMPSEFIQDRFQPVDMKNVTGLFLRWHTQN